MFNAAVINLFLILLIALLFYTMFKNQIIEEPMQVGNPDVPKKKHRTPCHASHNTLTQHHVKLNNFNNMFDNLELQLKATNKKVLENSNGIKGNEQSIKASANSVNSEAAKAGKAGDKIKY